MRRIEPAIALSQPSADEIKTTTCYMCACRCGIRVHLKDGKVRYIDGNRDHPVNKGVICGKGASGIMTHNSPSRLRAPLKRVGPRGSGEFAEISWDEALATATGWLRDVRERDPSRLAFFTGRDQSQALTGWFAQQYGTQNFAAHGGFCSVNMAAAGLYTFGGSFWEFGEPDWEHTRYFIMFGVAEDHGSNPIKMALGKLKAKGVKFVAVNPVRTGYGAIADEWIGIRPGTDGLFVGSLIHQLMRDEKIDLDYLIRYTNSPWLVIQDPASPDDGLFARDPEGKPLAFDRTTGGIVDATRADISPALTGEFQLPDGRRAKPAFALIAERYLADTFTPEATAAATGVSADTTRRIARELAHAAFEQQITLDIPWTDSAGRRHDKTVGRPVSMHAMRGISAHSNGFQTCRMLHLLQILLGSIDCPGGFRYKAPFPRPAPPANRPARPIEARHAALRRAARLPARPAGPAGRRRRQGAAHRQGLFVGRAARGPRPDAHGHHQRGQRRSLSGGRAVPVHGQHELEFVDEHSGGAEASDGQRSGDRRVSHSEDHLFRCLLLGDGGLCGPDPARHHLSGTLGLHLAAGPADLQPGRPGGRDPAAGGRARPRRARLPERAARSRRAARPAGLR